MIEILAGIIVVGIALAAAWGLLILAMMVLVRAFEFIWWVITAPWSIYRWWQNRRLAPEKLQLRNEPESW
jgi:hypothetical protein